ncbi:hypothetical protein OROMI_019621 [Orobanche minor]
MNSNLYNLQDDDSRNERCFLLLSGFGSSAFHRNGNRCGVQVGERGTRIFIGLSNRFRSVKSGDGRIIMG